MGGNSCWTVSTVLVPCFSATGRDFTRAVAARWSYPMELATGCLSGSTRRRKSFTSRCGARKPKAERRCSLRGQHCRLALANAGRIHPRCRGGCGVRHPCLTVRVTSSRPGQGAPGRAVQVGSETLPVKPRLPAGLEAPAYGQAGCPPPLVKGPGCRLGQRVASAISTYCITCFISVCYACV